MGIHNNEPAEAAEANERIMIDDYLVFLHDDVKEYQPLPPESTDRLSLATYLLGRAALTTVEQNIDPADTNLFLRAFHELRQKGKHETAQDTADRELFESVASLLFDPQDEERIAQARQQLHTCTMAALTAAMNKPDSFRYEPGKRPSPRQREDIDAIARYTALGLLTRLHDSPWLAMPALHFQSSDRARPAAHTFTMAVVEDCEVEMRAHKVKVTPKCLAFCGEDTDRQLAKRNLLRRQHASDISLISGCCDLDLHFPASGIDAPTAAKLLFEQGDAAQPVEIDILDGYSDRLLQLIADEPERKGLWE